MKIDLPLHRTSHRTRSAHHWIQATAARAHGLEALRPAHAHTDAMEAARAAFALAAVSSSMHTTSATTHTSSVSRCGGTGHVGGGASL